MISTETKQITYVHTQSFYPWFMEVYIIINIIISFLYNVISKLYVPGQTGTKTKQNHYLTHTNVNLFSTV